MTNTRPARKRVLIINYYWPPCGGVGVLRTLKFAKFLQEYGWEPVIYTAEDAAYPSIDYGNEVDIPEGLEIIRRPIIEPHGLYQKLMGNQQKKETNKNVFYTADKKAGLVSKLSLWARANLFIPDARALWIRPSVSFLTDYLKVNPVDAILSSGPPNTNTRIATLLTKKTGLPWLADWRDPWTQVDYYRSLPLTRLADRLHKKWEKEALELADRTTIVSQHWAKDLRELGAHNVHVVTNGFDREDFSELSAISSENKAFSITHLGILGDDRIPDALLIAAGELSAEDEGFKQNFSLQLIGQVTQQLETKAIAAGLVKEQLIYTGNLNRKTALGKAAASSVNLLLLNRQPNAAGRIPFKCFEYLALGRPILAFGPAESDVAEILSNTQAGAIYDYDDVAAAKASLRKLYDQWAAGLLHQPLDNRNLDAYDFRLLTGKIAGLLDEITT